MNENKDPQIKEQNVEPIIYGVEHGPVTDENKDPRIHEQNVGPIIFETKENLLSKKKTGRSRNQEN